MLFIGGHLDGRDIAVEDSMPYLVSVKPSKLTFLEYPSLEGRVVDTETYRRVRFVFSGDWVEVFVCEHGAPDEQEILNRVARHYGTDA